MLATKPLAFFKTDPKQLPTEFADSELLSLGNSTQPLGMVQPSGAKPDGTLPWGERCQRSAKQAGPQEPPRIITERVLSGTQVRLIELTQDMDRADLVGYEKWLGCVKEMCGETPMMDFLPHPD